MTGKVRLGVGRRLDTAAISAAARANPRLRGFVHTVGRHSRGGDRRAAALLEHLILRVLDDVGDVYAGPAITRLERIQVLRENVAAILDSVLRGDDVPPGVRVSALGDYFDHLDAEMRDLSSPRGGLLGDEPIRLSGDDPTVYAQTLIDEFEGTTAPGGGHTEPDLRPAFAGLPAGQQAAMRKVAAEDPAGLWRVVSSESEAAKTAALRDLEQGLGLTDAELADLRAAVDTLGKARSRGFHADPVRLAAALERIADKELRDIVAAGTDVWVVHQLAIHNPAALADAWARYKASAKGPLTPGGFRANIRTWMTHWGRATQGEFTAAFSLNALDILLKGPDYRPNEGGTDLVGIGHDGWVWVIDDKSHRAAGVSSATALTKNLAKNLRDDADTFRTELARWRTEVPDFVPDERVVDAIITMRGAAADIERLPAGLSDAARAAAIRKILTGHRLRLRVTSAMGEVVDVSDALRDLGLRVTPTGPTIPLPPRGGR
ncbi:MAG: hypothetical protein WBA97_13705 [Actinophytocola sp.]|uniref:hypothetical protein n=1 Tax=Actinophytocola sp. TaxID=1872138 RepID=UPI003C78DD34